MTYEFDGAHATSAMACAVQPVIHQPDPANVGRVGTDDGHPRARRLELTEPRVVPKAEAAQSVKGLWRPIFARPPFEQAVLLKRAA
jgi:hypothetical protein